MNGALSLFNRQRTQPVDMRLLRKITSHLLSDLLAEQDFDLAIHLINEREMTALNETSLQHAGSTDVITFDYFESSPSPGLAGELFVCVDEAMLQARRFAVTWQGELTRYIVHGILHLRGHDDQKPAARRKMKTEENRLVRQLSREFALSKLRSGLKLHRD